MRECERKKRIWIGQSAAKRRIDEGSQTTSREREQWGASILLDEDIVGYLL